MNDKNLNNSDSIQIILDANEIDKVTYYEDDDAYILEENIEDNNEIDNNKEQNDNDNLEDSKQEHDMKVINNLSENMDEIKSESIFNTGNNFY